MFFCENCTVFVYLLCMCAAESFSDRTEVQCLHRWQKVLDPELIKGPWTQEVCQNLIYFSINSNLYILLVHWILLQEDDVIINMVKKHGPKKWSVIARSLNGRIGKQCRERYLFWEHYHACCKLQSTTTSEMSHSHFVD